jgi:hypothetical protein
VFKRKTVTIGRLLLILNLRNCALRQNIFEKRQAEMASDGQGKLGCSPPLAAKTELTGRQCREPIGVASNSASRRGLLHRPAQMLAAAPG